MYHSIKDILDICEREKIEFWQVVQQADVQERGVSSEESFETMRQMYEAMKRADAEYRSDLRSASGLVGGDGEKLHIYNASGCNICGDFVAEVMEKAVKMGESNACMRRIVAAPTAGSCGVIPAVFLTAQEKMGYTDDKMAEALYISAGVGAVIAENASIAGAAGGCQAEIGSASAMAAAGFTWLQGGSAEMAAHASAMALKNMLGLACDPVCGLVEIPCVKRNVSGAVNAVTSSQMALAGIKSAIPVDEVIDAMRRIGNEMPLSLRETAQGGLATTKTAKEIALNI
ncbi:MAG: L-serine ammonia-lyase, iron-sulfur-dependent, subunit alpha [Clostridiales bacterium]|nr:L-serine ammonia-lyase, iron-sulfur-dependent, subunit alpha [Clostridiales bacterium]